MAPASTGNDNNNNTAVIKTDIQIKVLDAIPSSEFSY